jgi:hypothetical protein
MAAEDSFELLWNQVSREFSKFFTNVRDVFAVVGAYYVAKKSLTVLCYSADAFYVYFYSRFASDVDLPQKFGPWAGALSFYL